MPAARRQGGFGLLEAIVALTLLASTGVALFSWINVNMQTAVRLQTIDAAASLKIAAVGLLGGINPLQQAEGERQVGNVRVRWKAAAVGDVRAAAGQMVGGRGRFELQLFQTAVEVKDSATNQTVNFDLQMVGSRHGAAMNESGGRQ